MCRRWTSPIQSNWGKIKSWPVSKWVPWPRHWLIGKSPLCRFKAINQLLYPAAGSDQMGCVHTWQRSLSLETNTRSTHEISAPNQSWGGYHHPASNWLYQGHEVPYLFPRTSDFLPSLWTDVDHWPHALGMCSCRKFGMNTTLLTLWRPSLRRFPRLA